MNMIMLMVWKIMNGFSPSLEFLFVRPPLASTRGHSLKIFVPRCRTDVRARFFSCRVVPLWNSLPEDVVAAPSVSSFKSRLLSALGSLLFEFCWVVLSACFAFVPNLFCFCCVIWFALAFFLLCFVWAAIDQPSESFCFQFFCLLVGGPDSDWWGV